MDKVEVVWLDAVSDSGAVPLDVARQMQPVERSNLGYLLLADNKKVIIASALMADSVDERIVFPRCMVQKINMLEAKNE